MEINKLIKIMKQLRDPINGCSWDKEQDFKSIAPHTIEEAYEVVNAIDKNDFENLKEELGDLLLQVIFHSQMASEIEKFDFNDVVNTIISKLIRRHPHIFNNKKNLTSNEVKNQWEKIKKNEKKINNNFLDFDNIPENFPGTLRALKIQKKAATSGFDWENIDDAVNKINEEFEELKDAIKLKNKKSQIDEMGDLIFSCINLCRKLKINPDQSLQITNKKFIKRYRKAEILAQEDNKIYDNLNLSDKEYYWQKAKTS